MAARHLQLLVDRRLETAVFWMYSPRLSTCLAVASAEILRISVSSMGSSSSFLIEKSMGIKRLPSFIVSAKTSSKYCSCLGISVAFRVSPCCVACSPRHRSNSKFCWSTFHLRESFRPSILNWTISSRLLEFALMEASTWPLCMAICSFCATSGNRLANRRKKAAFSSPEKFVRLSPSLLSRL